MWAAACGGGWLYLFEGDQWQRDERLKRLTYMNTIFASAWGLDPIVRSKHTDIPA